ncbi:MAG: hypothetical protein K9I36_16735 [Bacteroidia bacterium]|nr:hypothetical protein [Bacteroidia bacterium]
MTDLKICLNAGSLPACKKCILAEPFHEGQQKTDCFNEKPSTVNEVNILQCPTCGFESTRANFKYHVNEFIYDCSKCGESFA